MQEVTILLPALNEAQAIGKTIDEIKNYGYFNILVVDNGSTDHTQAMALERMVKVKEEARKGKGYAVKNGLEYLATPFVIMMDSDYTYPAKYIKEICELLKDYDVVMAERHIRLDNSMHLTNLFGNRLLSLFGSILFWHWSSDICTGMWGFRMEAIEKFNITSPHFTLEADLFVNAVKNKCAIARMPIQYRSRLHGSQSHLTIWHGLEIGWFLIKKRLGIV
jgi:glycosyltransferase involved in cell wall biosynthesis